MLEFLYENQRNKMYIVTDSYKPKSSSIQIQTKPLKKKKFKDKRATTHWKKKLRIRHTGIAAMF